jgi:hypothetical protein
VGAFLKPEAAGVYGGQRNLVPEEPDIAEDGSDFLLAENDGELFLSFGANESQCGPITFDRVFIEELDTANSDGASASGLPLSVFDVEEIVSELLFCNFVRGFAIMLRKLSYSTDIHFLCALAVTF